MFRKVLCAGFVAMVVVSLAAAEEFMASIVKVDGSKVTFAKFKKGEKGKRFEKEAEESLPAAEKVKVGTGKFNFQEKKFEPGDALEGGLKNERFKNIGEKGLAARLVTEDGKITEIRVLEFKKKE